MQITFILKQIFIAKVTHIFKTGDYSTSLLNGRHSDIFY